MDKKEKEKLAKYGKLVCDFANGKTTYDILKSFFKNLQSAFYFSSDFPEKALKLFPTKQMIGELSSKEQEFFEKLLNQKAIIKSFNHNFRRQIDKYDPVYSMFTVSEFEMEEVIFSSNVIKTGKTSGINQTILMTVKEIEGYFENGNNLNDESDKLKGQIKTLAELGHQIENIRSESPKRFAEIEIITNNYFNNPKLHDHVATTQETLKRVISQIIQPNDDSYELEKDEITNMWLQYHKIKKDECYNKSVLLNNIVFSEDHFINRNSRINNEEIFNAPTSYCLIEFLMNPEYSGKERLTVCQKCYCIFSKSKLNGHQVYCPICSRKNKMTPEKRANYMKAYRANPARRKTIAREKREEKIRHYMTNAGKTREQAEIIVDSEM